jgi:ectoine hydroxylase-related dioxygenase (phytanoyl-CoA dioxygenase family)
MLKVSDYNFLKDIYAQSEEKISLDKSHKKIDVSDIDKQNLYLLKNQGFCVLKDVFKKEFIDDIRSDFQNQINSLKNISMPKDLTSKRPSIEDIYVQKLSKKTLDSGEKNYRNLTDSIKIKDPLINLPKTVEIALNKRIMAVSSSYFGYKPYLTFLKCVKTYANNLNDFDTQHFHIDENAIKFLKVFVYLNDVKSENDGPFTYIQGSCKGIKKKWGRYARWDETYLQKLYGKKRIVPILGNRGDVIIANTVAFHKGLKPITNDRNILIFTYGLHMDYTFDNKPDIKANIAQKDFDKLSVENRGVFSLLEKIAS